MKTELPCLSQGNSVLRIYPYASKLWVKISGYIGFSGILNFGLN